MDYGKLIVVLDHQSIISEREQGGLGFRTNLVVRGGVKQARDGDHVGVFRRDEGELKLRRFVFQQNHFDIVDRVDGHVSFLAVDVGEILRRLLAHGEPVHRLRLRIEVRFGVGLSRVHNHVVRLFGGVDGYVSRWTVVRIRVRGRKVHDVGPDVRVLEPRFCVYLEEVGDVVRFRGEQTGVHVHGREFVGKREFETNHSVRGGLQFVDRHRRLVARQAHVACHVLHREPGAADGVRVHVVLVRIPFLNRVSAHRFTQVRHV